MEESKTSEQYTAAPPDEPQPESAEKTADNAVNPEKKPANGLEEIAKLTAGLKEKRAGDVHIEIQNLYGDSHIGDSLNYKTTNTQQQNDYGKTYDLTNINELSNFVLEKKTSRVLALSLLLSVFDYVPFSELEKLQASLYHFLPSNPNKEEDAAIRASETYLSLDVMLHCIGAQQGEIEVKKGANIYNTPCIQMPNHDKVLKNYWAQFPFFRECIIRWLLNTIRHTSTFIYLQAARALYKIIKLDFAYGVDKIIFVLSKEKKNYYTLFLIFQSLYTEEFHEDELDRILDQWSDHQWLWKTAFLCSVHSYYTGSIQSILQEKLTDAFETLELDNADIEFIGRSLYLTSIVRDYTGKILNQMSKTNPKNKMALLYLFLIYYSYLTTNKDRPLLALVECDSEQQLTDLLPIIITIMQTTLNRKLFFRVLGSYLEELDTYQINVPSNLLLYFQQIAFQRKEFYYKIQEFLSGVPGRSARSISAYLKDLLEKASLHKRLEGDTV